MPVDPARVKALFQWALDLPDPADRAALLDRECGDDAELRARLAVLLEAYDRPAEALARPLAEIAPGAAEAAATLALTGFETNVRPDLEATAAGPTETFRSAEVGSPVGTIVAGRYKVRQEIGEGGMGSVYLAEQTHPVKRQVALKLIKAGMDSRTVLARFESERQALALMDHPNIARVLDAGSTEQGRPFFVMELVKGIPLTDYCDQHHLSLPDRLTLFRQICSAVQHAHQKGIIHRDLKPTNILVESHDDKPVPKVIDFGLAKATSGMPLTDQSLFTAYGSVTGTPLYMAPEQATFNALDVDTRADIYALGVILYELLTGSTPIRRDTMRRAALDEMLRVIREEEPPTPSSRISTSEGLPGLAAARHIEPSRLSRFVRGDLDWIVMKALAKERSRRYDSAIGLANDVERFTNHEPVSAGPPTAAYRVRKFVRRHRGRVAAAALVLVALVVGMVGTTWGLIEARRQEGIAHRQEAEARRQEGLARAEAIEKEKARRAEAAQRGLAESRRVEAEKRLDQVAKMNEILGTIFGDLNPRQAEKDARPLSAVLGERLDRAAAEIEGEATGDPLAVARMQQVLGASLKGLGYAEKAVAVLTKALATRTAALGADNPDTLATMDNLAGAYQAAGRTDRALPMYEELLAATRVKCGPDDPNTLVTMGNLAGAYQAAGRTDRALPMFEEVLAAMRTKRGADHPNTLVAMGKLAQAYKDAGRLDRALPMFEEVVATMRTKRGPDHPDTLATMGNLAQAYKDAGRLDRALPIFEEVVATMRTKLGPDHPDTLVAMVKLAPAYRVAGRLDRALPIFEEVLAATRVKRGPDHPNTLVAMGNLAGAYKDAGRLDRALPMFEEVVAASRVKLGPDHPDTLATMGNLAGAYKDAGRLDRALPMFEEVLAAMRSKLGADHPDMLTIMANLAGAYRVAGRTDRALELNKELLERRRSRPAVEVPRLIEVLVSIVGDWQAAGRGDRASEALDEALALCSANRKSPDQSITTSMYQCGMMLLKRGQLDRAIATLEEALALEKARRGADYPGSLRQGLALAYLRAGRMDRAIPLLEESLANARKAHGPENINTLAAMVALASAYQAGGQLDRALPLLREMVAGYRKRAEADPSAFAGSLAMLGLGLVEAKDWAEAESTCRECLAIREVKEPDAWTTFNTRSLLGGALMGQGKAEEAGPLLRSGCEGMKARAEKIPAPGKIRLVEALDRLIAWAEATGHRDEVEGWEQERAKLANPPTSPGKLP